MSDPIVRLVQDELEWFQKVLKQQRAIFPEQDNLYPIPFFGDIRHAEVLTLALNPVYRPPILRGGAQHRVANCVCEQRSFLREFLQDAEALDLHD